MLALPITFTVLNISLKILMSANHYFTHTTVIRWLSKLLIFYFRKFAFLLLLPIVDMEISD